MPLTVLSRAFCFSENTQGSGIPHVGSCTTLLQHQTVQDQGVRPFSSLPTVNPLLILSRVDILYFSHLSTYSLIALLISDYLCDSFLPVPLSLSPSIVIYDLILFSGHVLFSNSVKLLRSVCIKELYKHAALQLFHPGSGFSTGGLYPTSYLTPLYQRDGGKYQVQHPCRQVAKAFCSCR